MNETRSFYTPTTLVRTNSTQSNDPDTSRNMVTGNFKRLHQPTKENENKVTISTSVQRASRSRQVALRTG